MRIVWIDYEESQEQKERIKRGDPLRIPVFGVPGTRRVKTRNGWVTLKERNEGA